MTSINQKIPDELYQAFKVTASLQGLKIKQAVVEALTEYIKNHQTNHVEFNIKVIKDNRKNLLTFVYEEELKTLLSSIIEAKKRNASKEHILELKDRILKLAEKHPAISEPLANEIVAVFQTLSS